jgi:hypothetical protein
LSLQDSKILCICSSNLEWQAGYLAEEQVDISNHQELKSEKVINRAWRCFQVAELCGCDIGEQRQREKIILLQRMVPDSGQRPGLFGVSPGILTAWV